MVPVDVAELRGRNPADARQPLDAMLHVVLGFLGHDEVRGRCALVNRHWATTAVEVAPSALKGCRGDWVKRLINELQMQHSDGDDEGCFVVPTAQWPTGPHVRVEKMWSLPEDVEQVAVEAVVSMQAPFLQSYRQAASPALSLSAGDAVDVAPADFGINVDNLGHEVKQGNVSSSAIVTGVDGVEVRIRATFKFECDPSVYAWEHVTLVSPKHTAAWEEAMHQSVQEGVCHADDDVPLELRQRLQAGIEALAASQPADYHPNSDDIVRDHVHPALYPFVRGTSLFQPSADLPAPPEQPQGGTVAEHEDEQGQDMWGRPFETSTYQWLPTYFDVAAGSGHVTIRDDINNLRPRALHERLYSGLADLFGKFLPELDVARAYAEQVDFIVQDEDGQFEDGKFDDMDRPYLRLPVGARAAAAWQVITKIVDYELQPGQTYEGVWHVEGMSHEHILCTCLYVLDRGDDIAGGGILFKRGLNGAEAAEARECAGQYTDSVTRRMLDGEDALVPLGRITTRAGRRIVFPNSHVHKLTKLENVGQAPQRRRIVAFFVVDPNHRIVSTQECPDQRESMTRDEALQHRLALMRERKLHKQDWNARTIGLFEH